MGELDISKQEHWAQMQAASSQPSVTLQSDDGRSTFQSMSEVDAKIAAAEARTETKFATAKGELTASHAAIMGELRAIEKSTAGIKTTVVVTGIAAVGLVVAIFGWGSQMFGTGMDVQSVSDHSAKNVLQQVQPKFDAIDKQFADLNVKIGTLIETVQKTSQPSKQ